MNDVTSWVGILVLGFGLYSLYAAIQMKIKGEINQSLLFGKEYTYKKCKDKDAFIKEMFPQTLIFGLVTTFCGAVDVLNSFVLNGKLHVLYLIALGLFIVDFIIFTKAGMAAKKKYY